MHNDFPIPSIPLPQSQPPTIDPEVVASTPPNSGHNDREELEGELPDAEQENEAHTNSQSSTKENDAPTDIAAGRPSISRPQRDHAEDAVQRADSIEAQSGTLPPDLLSLYTVLRHTLERDFQHSPPYTIQRLAELALHPKRHYRFLPSFLRALDRVVNVSSPVPDFPLSTAHLTTHGLLTNGDTNMANGITEGHGLGSDESLGGALLTPIPWLRNNSFPHTAANGASNSGELRNHGGEEGLQGSGGTDTVSVNSNGVTTSLMNGLHPSPASPTLSDQSDASSSTSSGTMEAQLREQGGVTQGELLRQEQEAGVVPLTQIPPRRAIFTTSGAGAVAGGSDGSVSARPTTAMESVEEGADELPHARGPELIGPEDMGPQHHAFDGGLDLEAAVGRGRSKSPQPPPQVIPAPEAEAAAQAAEQDPAGRPGVDPGDVEKEVQKLREVMDAERQAAAARDADGDVVVADADGREVDEKEGMELTGDLRGADAIDSTTL